MITNDVKQEFIELRAKGYSFDKIAKKLGKAKQTLIDWSKELEEEIANYKALELESLYESYFLLKKDRIESFGQLLLSIKEELTKRDLSQVSTDKLLELYLKYDTKANEEIIEPKFKSSEEIRDDKTERRLLDSLSSPTSESTLKIFQ